MGEEGLFRPSWYDVVSLYSWVVVAGNSENLRSRLGFVVFCEFPGFLVKLVSEGLRRIFLGVILVFRLTQFRIPEGVGGFRQTDSLAKSP